MSPRKLIVRSSKKRPSASESAIDHDCSPSDPGSNEIARVIEWIYRNREAFDYLFPDAKLAAVNAYNQNWSETSGVTAATVGAVTAAGVDAAIEAYLKALIAAHSG